MGSQHASEPGEAAERSYPEMPWRLHAPRLLLASLHWADARSARAGVPPELPIVRFLPGRTIGGLFLAEYGPGSDLEYTELIVSAATVWHGGRLSAWITDLFVDDPASLAGGRALLGAPKNHALFSSAEGEITVGDPASPLCRLRYAPRLRLWRQRVRVAALHRDVRDASGATAAWHGEELRGRWRLARIDVEIPPTSPIRRASLADPLLGFCGTGVDLLLGGAPFLPLRLLPVSPAPER